MGGRAITQHILGAHKCSDGSGRPFKCLFDGTCTYGARAFPTLLQHMQLHGVEKKFKCLEVGCTYACHQLGQLKGHYVIHHGLREVEASRPKSSCSRWDSKRGRPSGSGGGAGGVGGGGGGGALKKKRRRRRGRPSADDEALYQEDEPTTEEEEEEEEEVKEEDEVEEDEEETDLEDEADEGCPEGEAGALESGPRRSARRGERGADADFGARGRRGPLQSGEKRGSMQALQGQVDCSASTSGGNRAPAAAPYSLPVPHAALPAMVIDIAPEVDEDDGEKNLKCTYEGCAFACASSLHLASHMLSHSEAGLADEEDDVV